MFTRICLTLLASLVIFAAGAPAQETGSSTEQLLKQAEGKFEKGDWAGAEADCTKVLDLSPDNPRTVGALVLRAKIKTQPGFSNSEQARLVKLDLDRAIALDPSNTEAYACRGDVNKWMNDDEAALSDYEKAAELDPKNGKAFAHLAREEEEQRNFGKARAYYERLIACMDRAIEKDSRDGQAYAMRGKARAKLGDLEGAIADLTQGVPLCTDKDQSLSMYIARGYIRHVMGDKLGADEDMAKALELGAPPGFRYEDGPPLRLEDEEAQAGADFCERVSGSLRDWWHVFLMGFVLSTGALALGIFSIVRLRRCLKLTAADFPRVDPLAFRRWRRLDAAKWALWGIVTLLAIPPFPLLVGYCAAVALPYAPEHYRFAFPFSPQQVEAVFKGNLAVMPVVCLLLTVCLILVVSKARKAKLQAGIEWPFRQGRTGKASGVGDKRTEARTETLSPAGPSASSLEDARAESDAMLLRLDQRARLQDAGRSLCVAAVPSERRALRRACLAYKWCMVSFAAVMFGLMGLVALFNVGYVCTRDVAFLQRASDAWAYVPKVFLVSILSEVCAWPVLRRYLSRRILRRPEALFDRASSLPRTTLAIEERSTFHKSKAVPDDWAVCALDEAAGRLLLEGAQYRYVILAKDVLELAPYRGSTWASTSFLTFRVGDSTLSLCVYRSASGFVTAARVLLAFLVRSVPHPAEAQTRRLAQALRWEQAEQPAQSTGNVQ